VRAALLLLAAVLVGCPDKREAVDDSDPLIRKMKAEQERLAKGGAPGGPPAARPAPADTPLAEVVQRPPDVAVPLPVAATPVTVGPVTLTPRRLEVAQTVEGPKVKLSTADRFLRVVVIASTTKEETFDLSQATVTWGESTAPLARDVQRVGQGSPLAATLAPAVPQDLVMYFEVPPVALAPGLTLVLPSSGGTLKLALQ